MTNYWVISSLNSVSGSKYKFKEISITPLKFVGFVILGLTLVSLTKKMRKRDLIIIISAFLSFILSVYLWFSGEKEMGQYVSIWVPTIIVYGIFVNTLPKR